jgi:hypothetical protein
MFGHTDNQQQTNGQSNQGGFGTDPAVTTDQNYNDPNANSNTNNNNQNNYLNDIPSLNTPANNTGGLQLPSTPFTPTTNNTSSDEVIQGAPTTDLSSTSPTNNNDALLDIKQRALQQLSPLVSHLEQTPEDKFKTTMMLIQASDNKDLLPDAYKAAQEITNEKAKAQALLDVVNEINYFTQPQ